MLAASSRFGRDEPPSRAAPQMNLNCLPCDFGNCTFAARRFMTQSRIEVVRQLYCSAFHGMPAYLGRMATVNGSQHEEWCPGTELNRRHEDFQSSALPTELPGREGLAGKAARTIPYAAVLASAPF